MLIWQRWAKVALLRCRGRVLGGLFAVLQVLPKHTRLKANFSCNIFSVTKTHHHFDRKLWEMRDMSTRTNSGTTVLSYLDIYFNDFRAHWSLRVLRVRGSGIPLLWYLRPTQIRIIIIVVILNFLQGLGVNEKLQRPVLFLSIFTALQPRNREFIAHSAKISPPR